MAKTEIQKTIEHLIRHAPVRFQKPKPGMVLTKRRRITGKVLFDAMMGKLKYVFLGHGHVQDFTPYELVSTERGIEKIARLLQPVAWEEYDQAPPGVEPGTKEVTNGDIYKIDESLRQARRLAAYFHLNIEPELGQTMPDPEAFDE